MPEVSTNGSQLEAKRHLAWWASKSPTLAEGMRYISLDVLKCSDDVALLEKLRIHDSDGYRIISCQVHVRPI